MTGTIKFPAEADRSCERPGNEDTRLHVSEMYTGAEYGARYDVIINRKTLFRGASPGVPVGDNFRWNTDA